MPRQMIVTRSGNLPNKAGALVGYHADLVLELIVQRTDNDEEGRETIYAELEMIELAIADLEAESSVMKPPKM